MGIIDSVRESRKASTLVFSPIAGTAFATMQCMSRFQTEAKNHPDVAGLEGVRVMRSVIRGAFIFIGSFVVLGLLLAPTSAFAAQPLPFTASYNCPGFVQSSEILPKGCTDIADSSWFGEPVGSCGGNYSQLTSAANRSGSAGLGARQWVGPSYTNGFGINFTPTSSVNIRWYERYAAGINLGNNPHKDVYIRDVASGWNQYAIPEPDSQNGSYRIAIMSVGSNIYSNPPVSIPSLIDGNWHCYEVHLDPRNVSVWIDGAQVINNAISTSNTWSAVVFGSNTVSAIQNSTCLPIDYDDIAITAGTYIGPVGSSSGGSSGGSGGSATLPPPTNLHLQ